MMSANYLNNPKHWRERAEETRTKAEQLWYSPDAKNRMLRIADEYDRLADQAAERVRMDHDVAGRVLKAPQRSGPEPG